MLFEPAVLKGVQLPKEGLKLVQAPSGSKRAQQLLATADGDFEIELQDQLQLARKDAETGLTLATQDGLVNELQLTLKNLDVDVISPHAVSIERERQGSNTVARLVLTPANDAGIALETASCDVQGREAGLLRRALSTLGSCGRND